MKENICTSEFIDKFIVHDGQPFIVSRLRRSVIDDNSRWICINARVKTARKLTYH